MSDDTVTYLDAATAAAAVGVSVSGLRRLAPIYESVFGKLPRAGKGSGDSPRMWSLKAAHRLAAARRLVETGQRKSVKTALEALEGVEGTGDSLEVPQIGSQLSDRQLLEAVLSELVELRSEIETLRASGRALPQAVAIEPAAADRPGLLVRAAIRFERAFKQWF